MSGKQPFVPAGEDHTARAVRVVARLLACPDGQTRHELARYFGWPSRDVTPLLACLTTQHMIERWGERYRATPDATTRLRRNTAVAARVRSISLET